MADETSIPAPFAPEFVTFIRRILSVAETGKPEWDPSAVYIYADDNRSNPPRKQVTLSIGFTESGNLKKVLQAYVDAQGIHGIQFAPYLPAMGSGPSLASDSKFIALLKEAGKDPVMVETQKKMFDRFYLGPAFRWASDNGFTLPLSFMVIADSYLHSGSMMEFLMNRFAEKKPAKGGNEKKWITEYCKARKDWLANHSNKVLRSTVYRMNCFLGEISRGNWMMEEAPIVMNGTPVRIA